MNHYDEFGLTRDASAEQIKEAYRNLVRLLHPDQQQEPALQAAADLQLRRLNRIYEVLSDPALRSEYDREQAGSREEFEIVTVPPPPFLKRSSTAWTAAAVSFLMLLVWMASRQISPSSGDRESGSDLADAGARLVEKPAAPGGLTGGPRLFDGDRALQRKLAQVTAERDAALAKLAIPPEPVRIAQLPEHHAAALQPSIIAVAPAEPAPDLKPMETAVQVLPQPAPLPRNPIAGEWVYRPTNALRKNKDLYPPEFILTSISEENGLLRGTYRARYIVPDRPVPPDVNFQFAGKLTGDSGSLPWNGSGGSKGEVTIKLTADHTLRVDWVASQVGDLGFYKGTALLVKKDD